MDGAEDAGDEPRGGRAPGDHPSAGAAEPEQEWAASVRDHLPLTVRAKLGLERGHAAVIVLVALLGVLGAAVVFLLARPEVVPVDTELTATGTPAAPDEDAPPPEPESEAEPDDPPAADGAESHGGVPADDGSAASAPAGTIMVHVAGLVAEPGVVELPAGVRVVDAIEAAGGPAADADLTPVNLARVLTDGEQVVVTAEPPPGQPAEPPPAPGTGPDDATAGGPVDLNTATADDLDTLPGIGPTLAGRILEWREHNGRFTTVDELREVSGIGEQRFAELEPLVTV